MYGLQHGAFAHTEQQAIKAPNITSVKPFKRVLVRWLHSHLIYDELTMSLHFYELTHFKLLLL